MMGIPEEIPNIIGSTNGDMGPLTCPRVTINIIINTQTKYKAGIKKGQP